MVDIVDVGVVAVASVVAAVVVVLHCFCLVVCTELQRTTDRPVAGVERMD